MSIYRCAVCGSSRVVPETKQEGYNKNKGIFGMALFGLGGAVAGASGNTVVYYHCAACGHTLNRCMSEIDKKFLEQYLLKPTDEVSIIRLREYKKQYPNIEWEELTIDDNLSVNTNQTSINKDNLEKEEIHDIEVAIINALYEINMPCTIAEIQAMDKSCKKYSIPQLSFAAKCLVKANIIEKSIEDNETCFGTILSSKKEAFWSLHRMEVKQLLEQEQEQKETAINKNAIDKHSIAMAILNALYTAEQPCTISEIQAMDKSCFGYSNQSLFVVAKELVNCNIVEKIRENNKMCFKAIPDSKDEAIKMLDMIQAREQKETAINKNAIDKHSIAIAILDALYTAEQPCTITEMQTIESCEGYSNQSLSAVARELVNCNIVEKIIENNKVYFKAIPNSKDEAVKMLGNI